MNLEQYRLRRQQLLELEPKFHEFCCGCLQPEVSCYCSQIRRFDPKISFVILIHPIEARRRIATGRMAHQCLEGSYLIRGQNFSQDKKVIALLRDPDNFPLVLFPGAGSTNLTRLSSTEREDYFPKGKKPVVFVIDGTWTTVGKMVRLSQNLSSLPRICFSPDQPSEFRIRQQPKPECYSTIEAIHYLIHLMGPSCGFDVTTRDHDKLLYAFRWMVEEKLAVRKKREVIRPLENH